MEDTARAVLRSVRHALERGSFSRTDAIEVAMMQLLRPGRPAARLSVDGRSALRTAVTHLVASLDPAQPRSMLAFARACAETSWSLVKPPRHPGADMAAASAGSVAELARAAVWAEVTHARDADDHVQRAVTRALRERRRGRGLMRLELDNDDPLRAVLDVPAQGRVVLPRTDVRTRIAAAAAGTAFGAALRQAARFSEEVIRPALGEELWSICRPVAFTDKAETRVVVEVRSALLAHEAQLRSQELVHRLRTLEVCRHVRGVRIVVVEPTRLPVVPPRHRG